MVMGEGNIPLHSIIPEDKQGPMMRLDAILNELLSVNDYPEDVGIMVVAHLREWVAEWNARGVRKGGTFSEFQTSQIPGFVKEAMSISQQIAAGSQRDAQVSQGITPPGRRAS